MGLRLWFIQNGTPQQSTLTAFEARADTSEPLPSRRDSWACCNTSQKCLSGFGLGVDQQALCPHVCAYVWRTAFYSSAFRTPASFYEIHSLCLGSQDSGLPLQSLTFRRQRR